MYTYPYQENNVYGSQNVFYTCNEKDKNAKKSWRTFFPKKSQTGCSSNAMRSLLYRFLWVDDRSDNGDI